MTGLGILRRLMGESRAVELPEERVAQDEARMPLHVLADDARLRIEDGQLMLEAGETEESLRLHEVAFVALHGGAQVSVPCLQALARASVPLILLSRSGYYLGQMVDLSSSHAAVRRAQYRTADDPKRCLELARPLVAGKISGAARLARRRGSAKAPLVRQLDKAARAALRARKPDELRGIEGAATAAWYAAWPDYLARDDSLFLFDGRTRRPPRDAVNALLSYLYAVAAGTTAAAAAAVGLDPNVGFLHGERAGRPALALDLVEPLRTAVVDAAVIAAINNGEFAGEDFERHEDGGMRLTRAGRRQALAIFERRLSTVFRHDGVEMTWRAAIARHSARLAHGLRRGEVAFAPPLPQ